ncbi:hypothetical protein ACFZDJ_06330 [Streptomyces sp. NPDC007896]|uniref:hypothetical protein n=1 Tax=unclassified Streptomyces TaxID=2593676 RepID=UPI0036EE3B47
MDHSSASGDELAGIGLDCSIYIDSDNREAILRCVAHSLGGSIEASDMVRASAVKAYVAHNDYEIDSANRSDFVAWPSVVECEQASGASAEAFVNAIGECLSALWHAGFRAVAACEFEDRLPHSGGVDLFS